MLHSMECTKITAELDLRCEDTRRFQEFLRKGAMRLGRDVANRCLKTEKSLFPVDLARIRLNYTEPGIIQPETGRSRTEIWNA